MFKRKVCSVGSISCDKVYFSPLLTNELEFSKLGFRLATYWWKKQFKKGGPPDDLSSQIQFCWLISTDVAEWNLILNFLQKSMNRINTLYFNHPEF